MYRPAITASFFAELSDVLDRLSTYVDPSVLAGDLSIRLECTADPHTVEFCEFLDSDGLVVQRVQDVTHDAGGILDVVCSHGDLPSPSVDIHEIGLSDHRLLGWTAPLCHPDTVYLTANRGPGVHLVWMPLCLVCKRLHCAMNSSSSSEMVMRSSKLYDDTVTAVLNEQIPVRRSSLFVVVRRRMSHCEASAAAVRESCSSRWSSLVCQLCCRCFLSAVSMPVSCVRRSLPSGLNASMLSNRSHVNFD